VIKWEIAWLRRITNYNSKICIPMPTLEIRELSKAFGGNRILENISLGFSGGGLTAIVGLNGSGKTTLLDLLCGIASPDDGDILVNGHSILKLPMHRVFQLGIARLFQDIRIFEELTVLENVMAAMPSERYNGLVSAIFMRPSMITNEKHREIRANQILKAVGLRIRASALGGNISYGEQRLLALARLFATNSSILLLDEPCSGIKTKLAENLLKTARDFTQQGSIAIVVEHNLNLVAKFADSILVIAKQGIHEVSQSMIQDGHSLAALIERLS